MPATSVQSLTILGSTGSIGTQALEVISAHPHRFKIAGLSAGGGDIDLLAQQVLACQPQVVGVANPSAIEPLRAAISHRAAQAGKDGRAILQRTEILAGTAASSQIAAGRADLVLNGITSYLGLL